MNLTEKYLGEGIVPKNWKSDPWGARDKLWMRAISAAEKIKNIEIFETQFFYNVDKKHIADVGKKLQMVEKGVQEIEKVTKKL